MPVMKRLTVDGVNYDTVGEASVTQVQTSGTKIATVTIDGTATDLYAPEGGGGGSTVTVTPILTSGTQTATIDVDGTTSTLYAPTPPIRLIPVFVNGISGGRATVAIPDVGPDDVVAVFSSFANNNTTNFVDYGTYRPYVERNVSGNITFKFASTGATNKAIGMLVAVISGLELQVFGMDSATVSNRKPSAGETITVTGSGSTGTYTLQYVDTVTGETVTYATLSGVSTYTGSFVMPSHSVYLVSTFTGGGNN